MPGWYIHINVARKAIDALATNPTAGVIFGTSGPDAVSLTSIAHNDRQFRSRYLQE
jgi:hypothetical protein